MTYKYTAIKQCGKWIIRRTHYENLCQIDEYFTGYDYTNSACWVDSILHRSIYEMESQEKAEAIICNMKEADATAAPAEDPGKKQFLLRVKIDGEWHVSIETGRRIAEIYDLDQDCGVYGDMEVWDVTTGDPKEISLLGLVSPILDQKRWIQREYEDYCNDLRYADWN